MATEIVRATKEHIAQFVPNMLLDERLDLVRMRLDPHQVLGLQLKASKIAYAMLFDEKVCALAGARSDKGLPDSAGLFWLNAGQVVAEQPAIFKRELGKVCARLLEAYDPLVQMMPAGHRGLGWWHEMGWHFGDRIERPAGPAVVPVYYSLSGQTFGRSTKVDFAAEAAASKHKPLVIQ